MALWGSAVGEFSHRVNIPSLPSYSTFNRSLLLCSDAESTPLPPGSILNQDACGAISPTGHLSLPDSRTSGRVIPPVDGIASLYQDLYDRRSAPISLGGECHVDHVRLMGDGRPGPRRCSDDEEGVEKQFGNEGNIGCRRSRMAHAQPAGCSKRPSSKAAASEEARRYIPHFVWAVRPCNGTWRTEKPLQRFRPTRNS